MVLEILWPVPGSGIKPESLTVELAASVHKSHLHKLNSPIISIIAVHGLNGDATNTWKTPESFWLKDFLPHDIDGARVMTFGYNADVAFGNTTASIKDHAVDLLGSLIDVREDLLALAWAHVEAQYSRIKDSTKGIVFFGTPHRGSDKATYGSILANVATTMMRKPSSKLINALKTNSDDLEELTARFRFQAPDYQILTFYEMKPMKMFSGLIVEKRSVLLEISEEDQQPVDANHREMCKFNTRDDQVYQKLVKRLARMLKHDPRHDKKHQARNKFYEVPQTVSPRFTGRIGIGQKLVQQCLPPDPMHLQREQKRFIIYGLGGSGKTQVCLKFAQDHREKFWGVFFIDASSLSMAEQALSTLAQTCKVGESMQNFLKCLSNSLEPWLLILDNADDPSLELSQLFPVGNRGTIIVTTRNRECTFHDTVGSHEMHKMDNEEAIDLLLRSSNHPIGDEDLRNLALPIVHTLGHLALAVIHAGASIRHKICSLEDFLEHYEKHRKKLFSSRPLQVDADYRYTVYTTWEISLDSLKAMAMNAKKDDHAAADALDLLNLFGFCHFSDISESILKSAWEEFPDFEEFPWWMSNQLRMVRERSYDSWDPLPFREAIQLLSSYSLIRLNASDDRISLHPLVHTWIRDSMDEETKLKRWNMAVSTLALASDFSKYHLSRQLIVHVRHSLSLRILDHLFVEDDFPLDRIEIARRIQFSYSGVNPDSDTLVIAHRNYSYCISMLGLECKEACLTACDLAYIHNQMRDYQKVINVLQDMYNICIRIVGGAGNLTSRMIWHLCWAYSQVDRKQEALELAQKGVSLYEASPDDKNEGYLIALETLSMVYRGLGRGEEALAISERIVDKRKETEGENSNLLFRAQCNLTDKYVAAGQYQAGLELTQVVLEKAVVIFGEEHLTTLKCMSDLGYVYGCLDQPRKGIPLMIKALDIGRRIGVDEYDLDKWEKYLTWLQSLQPDILEAESQGIPRTSNQHAPKEKPWKFWRKNRRDITGSSTQEHAE